MKHSLALLLALTAAGVASAQQPAPTPASERVVVPSLPDQPNKEGAVTPSGAMKTDAEGYVLNDRKPVDPRTPVPANAGSAARPAPAPVNGVPAPAPVPGAGARGKTVVNAAFITLRGVVKAYEKGVSITIAEANGKERTVPLAEKAGVYDGLAVGDKVAVRIPLQKPADGKSASRVDRQRPPKAPPKSKFSQAQSPGN
jgi:hypothetical protein